MKHRSKLTLIQEVTDAAWRSSLDLTTLWHRVIALTASGLWFVDLCSRAAAPRTFSYPLPDELATDAAFMSNAEVTIGGMDLSRRKEKQYKNDKICVRIL